MSMLTDIQQEDILRAFEASKDVEWCSGGVSWPSATLPLVYVTRHGRDDGAGDNLPAPATAGHNGNAEPEVT